MTFKKGLTLCTNINLLHYRTCLLPMKTREIPRAYRWFSRYVIAAMLVDENKRFLISSFCSSTSNCTLQHCYLCPWRLVANHLYQKACLVVSLTEKHTHTHKQTWPKGGKTMTSTATISIYTCIFPVLKPIRCAYARSL